MKKNTAWIIAAILGLCLVAVGFALARAWAYRPIVIEGTITDDQGNPMNGVSAYVSFSRRKGEDWFVGIKTLEETVDSSFHFEGKGDRVYVRLARKGYAPGILMFGDTAAHFVLERGDRDDLIMRDLRVVMKKLTPEELEERLFRDIHEWRSVDLIVRHKGEKYPTDEDQLEGLRKRYGLEKSDMTDLFVKAIQDYHSVIETKSEDKKFRDWHNVAMRNLHYYPLPQQEFLELTRKTVELEPEIADRLIESYTKAYPDWVFDDETILELTGKSSMELFNLRSAGFDLGWQVRQEKDEARRKRLLDKAFEWAFQDDKIEIFHSMDRLLLDNRGKEYAELPARKERLEKELESLRKKDYPVTNWCFRRTKYALEHFGEGEDALKTLYDLDTNRAYRTDTYQEKLLNKEVKDVLDPDTKK